MALTKVKGSIIDRGVWVEDFGAVGDGVTDDTAAIQAAIDEWETVGGTLISTSGVFLISSPLIFSKNSSNNVLDLAGEIKCSSTYNNTMVKFIGDFTLGYINGLIIKRLYLNGNKTDGTYSLNHGMQLKYFSDSKIDKIYIYNTGGKGIYFNGYCDRNIIGHIYEQGCNGYGIHLSDDGAGGSRAN
jgi:polygalacturonase